MYGICECRAPHAFARLVLHPGLAAFRNAPPVVIHMRANRALSSGPDFTAGCDRFTAGRRSSPTTTNFRPPAAQLGSQQLGFRGCA
jgi:hypothetical protein